MLISIRRDKHSNSFSIAVSDCFNEDVFKLDNGRCDKFCGFVCIIEESILFLEGSLGKDDVLNTTAYVYFAMYGIISGTKNFTKNFQFTYNDWSDRYTDIDTTIKDTLDNVTLSKLAAYLKGPGYEAGKTMLYDENKVQLRNSETIKDLGYNTYDSLIKMLEDEDASAAYFAEHDIYMSLRNLQSLIKDFSSPTAFTQTVKKIYRIKKLENLYANSPYIKCSFAGRKLKILN